MHALRPSIADAPHRAAISADVLHTSTHGVRLPGVCSAATAMDTLAVQRGKCAWVGVLPPLLLLGALLVLVLAAQAGGQETGAGRQERMEEPQQQKVEEQQPPLALWPDHELTQQVIGRGASMAYTLAGLRPLQMYEVRVSYLGLDSVNMAVGLRPGHAAGAGQPDASTSAVLVPRRRLLDTEKAMFTTDADGLVNGWADVHALVICEDVAVPVPGVGSQQAVRYNVVLETLYFGAPAGAFRLAAVCLLALAGALCVVVPAFNSVARDMREAAHKARS